MSRWAYHMARETIRGIESMRRAREADERRAIREAIRAQRDAERQALRDYQCARHFEAEHQTRTAEALVGAIRSILSSSRITSTHDWRDLVLLEGLSLPSFIPPSRLVVPLSAPNERDFVDAVHAPAVPWRWLPFVRRSYDAQVAAARQRFARASAEHRGAVRRREADLRILRDRHEVAIGAIKAMRDGFRSNAEACHLRAVGGDTTALSNLIGVALAPEDWILPTESFPLCRVTIDEAEREVIVDVSVSEPSDVVPSGTRFRYVKRSDEIRETSTSMRAMQAIYRDYLAGVLLTVAHAVLVISEGVSVEAVTCNARRCQQDDEWCCASIRVDAERWRSLDFARADAWTCFRDLRGRVPSKPLSDGIVEPFASAMDREESASNELLVERDAILDAIQELRGDQPLGLAA